MNPERLKKLQAQVAQVRIGGKGEFFITFTNLFFPRKLRKFFTLTRSNNAISERLFCLQALHVARRRLSIRQLPQMIKSEDHTT